MPEAQQERCGLRVGEDIPQPLVDLETATRSAKARLHALRSQPAVKAGKVEIIKRHGSRRPDWSGRSRLKKSVPTQRQLEF